MSGLESESSQGKIIKPDKYSFFPVSLLGAELRRLALGLAYEISRYDVRHGTIYKEIDGRLLSKSGYYKGNGFVVEIEHSYPSYSRSVLNLEDANRRWDFASTAIRLDEMVQTGDGLQKITTEAFFRHPNKVQAWGPANSTPNVVRDLREAFTLVSATLKLQEIIPPSGGVHDPEPSIQYLLDRLRTLTPENRISIDDLRQITWPWLSRDALM